MAMARLDCDTPDLAEAYARASPLLFVPGKRLVEALHLAPGQHVLDVGCGTGVLAEHVARLVGPEGLVVGIDPLPHRVALAQRRQRANLTCRIGNAFDLSEFATGAFDAAYLHLVLHWLPEKRAPLRQLHRVLKPGAPVGITTSARDRDNTLITACATVLSRSPYNAYAAAAPSEGRVTSTELADILADSGFRVTRLETESTIAEWRTAEQALVFFEAITAGNPFAHLDESLRQAARVELAAVLERHRQGGVIRTEGARILAIASTC
jgi:arsenite methyltransferase